MSSISRLQRALRRQLPGMDPYLEEPSGWPSVHHWLISTIGETLINQLAPHFYVTIEERVYITDLDDPESRQQIAPYW